MRGINFKDDCHKNFLRKAKNVKDLKEQAAINQGLFDYIQILQAQIDELAEKDRKTELP